MMEMRVPMQEEILQYFTSNSHNQMKAKWNRRLSDSCVGTYLNNIPTASNITSNTNIPKGIVSPRLLINLQDETEDEVQQQTFHSNPSNAENANQAIKTIFRRKSFGNCGVTLLNRSSYVKKVDGLFPVSVISQHVKQEEAEARRRQSQLNARNNTGTLVKIVRFTSKLKQTSRASKQNRLSNSSITEEITRTPKHSKTNNLGHDSYRGSLFAINNNNNNSNLLEGISKSTSNLPEFSSGGQTFRNIACSTPQKMAGSSNNGSIHLIGMSQQLPLSREVSDSNNNNNGGDSTLSRRAEKSKTTVKPLSQHQWQLNLPDNYQQAAHYNSEQTPSVYTPLNFSDVANEEQPMTARKPQKHPSICNSITLNPPSSSRNSYRSNQSSSSNNNNNDFSHAVTRTNNSNNLVVPNSNHAPMTQKLQQRIAGSHFGSQSQGSLLVYPSGYAPKQSSYGDQKDQRLPQSKYQQQQPKLLNNPSNSNFKNPSNPQSLLQQQQQQQQLRIRLHQAEEEGLSEQDILSQSQMSSAQVIEQQQQQYYFQDCRNSESGAECDSCFDVKENDNRSTGTIDDCKQTNMADQKKQYNSKQVSLFDMDAHMNVQQPKHSHVTNYWRFLDSKLANSNAILSEIQTERRGQQLLLNQQQIHLPPLSMNRLPKILQNSQDNPIFITSSRSQHSLNTANLSPGRKHHHVFNSQQGQTIADYSSNQPTTGKVLLLQEYYETRQKQGGAHSFGQSPNKTKKQRRSLPDTDGYSLYQSSAQHSLLRPTVSSSFSQLKYVAGNGEIKKKLKNKEAVSRKNAENNNSISNSNTTSPLKQQQQHHRLLLNINTASTAAASASFSKNAFTLSPSKKILGNFPEKLINPKAQFLRMDNFPLRKPSHRKTRSSVSKGRISKHLDSNTNNTNINYNESSTINQE